MHKMTKQLAPIEELNKIQSAISEYEQIFKIANEALYVSGHQMLQIQLNNRHEEFMRLVKPVILGDRK